MPVEAGGARLTVPVIVAVVVAAAGDQQTHPAELEQKDVVLRMLIESWQKQGLMGVEVYHPSWLKRGYPQLDAQVRRMGLLVTGGSDYHCNDNYHGQPGITCPYWHNAEEDVQMLLKAMEDMHA